MSHSSLRSAPLGEKRSSRRRRFLATLGGLAALARRPLTARAADASADLIVTGATIHTVDDGYEHAEAFAVRDGRFAAVGSRALVDELRGPRTQVVDLSGRTVLTGLIDGHLHLLGVGTALHEADLYGARSFDEIVRRTVAFAHASPDAWIVGDGWDQNRWPGAAFPRHDALSAAIPDRPVVLRRVDGHALLANARAMVLAGVTTATQAPAGGRILRDDAGAPTGVLIDAAMDVVRRAQPAPVREQRQRAVGSAIAACHRYGLTSVAEPGIDDATLDAYTDLLEQNDFPLRVYAMLDGSDDALIARHFANGPQRGRFANRLWVSAVKLYADGALGSRGAALLAPYEDDPANSGLVITPRERITDVTERALRAGFQVCAHAIGDRANRNVLDAYETALARVPANDHRLRIEHAQVIAASDIRRFARLGVVPSMQTTHQTSDMPWAQRRLGADRLRGAYAWRSLLDAGSWIANGTDAPVESVSTLRTFHAAVTRQDESGNPPGGWNSGERMTRAEALRSMTIWAARANFQERLLGSIAPGKIADFVVMDRDWMSIPTADIMGTRVLATYLGGQPVFDADTATTAVALRPRPTGCRCGRT